MQKYIKRILFIFIVILLISAFVSAKTKNEETYKKVKIKLFAEDNLSDADIKFKINKIKNKISDVSSNPKIICQCDVLCTIGECTT